MLYPSQNARELTKYVLKQMMFHFAGSNHSKYLGYILEMIATLELESTAKTKDAFLRNWLVNPSGESGRHQEGDLMQEHLNLALEEAVKRSGSEWDGKLIRDVISRNIHYFVDLKNGWGETVGLKKRKGYHPEPHSQPEIKILTRTYKEAHLHEFIRHRSCPSSPETSDRFGQGIQNLQAGKLKKWIADSMRGHRLQETSLAAMPKGIQELLEEDITGTEGDDSQEASEVDPIMQVGRGNVRLVDRRLVVEVESDDGSAVHNDLLDGEEELTDSGQIDGSGDHTVTLENAPDGEDIDMYI